MNFITNIFKKAVQETIKEESMILISKDRLCGVSMEANGIKASQLTIQLVLNSVRDKLDRDITPETIDRIKQNLDLIEEKCKDLERDADSINALIRE